MQELVQRSASADNLYAAALFAQEEGRASEAASLVERIPARLRSADASRLLRATAVQSEVAAAAEPARYGQYDLARQRLMQIVARPDPSGETAAQAVRALNAVGDTRGAVDLARMALATNANAAPAGRIALADALLDAGQGAEATAIAASLTADPRLTAQDRQRLSGLQTGIAIRESDRLNEAGDQAAAYDRLAPALSAKPQDPDVNLALARLYQGAQDPARAQDIAEAVLRRDPRNADARLAAASAAIARGQTRRAEELLAEGRTLTPNDPRVAVVEAQLARSSGDYRRAQAALQRAEELRQAQLRGTQAAAPALAAQPALMRNQTANPFRQVALAGGEPAILATAAPAVASDPLLGDIQRQLAEVREEAAPRVGPNFAGRFRSGSGGLDRLQEYSGGAEASAAMPGIGGRIAARAQLYSIDSGTLDQSTGNLRRFGTNPLMLPGASESISAATASRLVPKDTTASGATFGLGYTRGESLSLDLGTTPIGYRVQNMVGGLELAPSLNGNLRLRLTGERRAVTDSLLAWAGQRDPVTSRVWGGVVRNTGRGQFEWSAGRANFYAGGGYSQFEGKGVADNSRIEAGAGMSYAFFRRPDEELTSGLDLVYLSYDKNLRFFTLGQGGYFSPQNYVAANIPIDYRARIGNLSYHLGGQIGLAHFKEDRSPLFPNDPALQAQAESRAAADSTQSAFYSGQTQTSLVGGVRADAEYAVTPQFKVGGLLRYDRAADWNEVRAMLFARYRFD
ncbi:cellulose synthase subunit BcsC-related outer membrane protein [Roseomonas gilardii subsp. gilardii]|uniref:cellulose biosynthesis protein BcsC n=1 Tax=Roseomonas gilardii TaxID=257708 RepID=UPI001FF7958F|nr:cellulose biosynthesis protein BcsC [Roseomonas gilardii]UPG71328.1 cellulose synthase subunit BcsC-related outer membrane protein [Roseomonas gilardii subsp. gilardii]